MAGAAGGVALNAATRHLLASGAEQQTAAKRGVKVESADQFLAVAGPTAFMLAAGTGAGLLRRSQNVGLGVAILGASALLTGIASSTVAKSDTEFGGSYLSTLGLNLGAAAVGAAIGYSAHVPVGVAETVGLAAMGISAGVIGTETAKWGVDEISQLRNSVNVHRNTP